MDPHWQQPGRVSPRLLPRAGGLVAAVLTERLPLIFPADPPRPRFAGCSGERLQMATAGRTPAAAAPRRRGLRCVSFSRQLVYL